MAGYSAFTTARSGMAVDDQLLTFWSNSGSVEASVFLLAISGPGSGISRVFRLNRISDQGSGGTAITENKFCDTTDSAATYVAEEDPSTKATESDLVAALAVVSNNSNMLPALLCFTPSFPLICRTDVDPEGLSLAIATTPYEAWRANIVWSET